MPITTKPGKVGYVRIYTFNTSNVDPNEFVDEFARILDELPESGLILDVRGNPGGSIPAAEGLLQLLTPLEIQPTRAQFYNSPLNLQICENYRIPDPERFSGLDLGPWVPSMRQAVSTGSVHSNSFPISDSALTNRLGQRYHGPVILITDALCYSATDIFAAGFRDHDIGFILGTDNNTGAGGANVWTHTLLAQLARQDRTPSPYAPLPLGAGLRVAVRRTLRVGREAGSILEDLGIEPQAVYPMSREDILKGNAGLIEAAAQILSERPSHRLRIHHVEASQFIVATRNLTRIDLYIDGRPLDSFNAKDGENLVDLSDKVTGSNSFILDLYGFSETKRVARYRYRHSVTEA